MHNIAGFGRLIGWISIVIGGATLLIGLIITPDISMAEFDRCIQQQRLGFRQAPCPPPSGIGEKWLLVGAGVGSLASGIFFLLLSGILTTLLEIKEIQERAARARAASAGVAQAGGVRASVAPGPARYVHPAPPKQPKIPTRFEMQQRYGEVLGNRAWAMLDKQAREGEPMPEQEAVEAARSAIRAEQG